MPSQPNSKASGPVAKRVTRAPRKRPTKAERENKKLAARIAELEALAPSENADPRLPTRMTNEAIAKREADRRERGVERDGPAVTITREPWEKQFDQKGDQLAEGLEPFEVQDPMHECIKRHTPKGHRGRMLSETTCRLRGMRGWHVVLDAKGNKFMVGNMFLGSMPEERAVQREVHYKGKAREQLAKIKKRFKASQDHAKAHDLDTAGNEIKISRRVVETAPVELD